MPPSIPSIRCSPSMSWLDRRARSQGGGGQRRVARAGAALLMLALSSGCTQWGPISSYYNGNRVVGAKGFANIDPEHAYNSIELHDDRNDHNRVYAHTYFSFYEYSCTVSGNCSYSWKMEALHTTPEIENTYATFMHQIDLMPQWNRVRVETSACAQMGFPVPDSCSNHAFVTYDY